MNIIELRNGPALPEHVILLALSLEAEDRKLSVTADGKLSVVPGAGLTDVQRTQIKAARRHLMELVAYQPPEAR